MQNFSVRVGRKEEFKFDKDDLIYKIDLFIHQNQINVW